MGTSASERRAERICPLVEANRGFVDDYCLGDRPNAISGSGQADHDTAPMERQKYSYDLYLDPRLGLAGQAKRTPFEDDTVSLLIHERERYRVRQVVKFAARLPWLEGVISDGWPPRA